MASSEWFAICIFFPVGRSIPEPETAGNYSEVRLSSQISAPRVIMHPTSRIRPSLGASHARVPGYDISAMFLPLCPRRSLYSTKHVAHVIASGISRIPVESRATSASLPLRPWLARWMMKRLGTHSAGRGTSHRTHSYWVRAWEPDERELPPRNKLQV